MTRIHISKIADLADSLIEELLGVSVPDSPQEENMFQDDEEAYQMPVGGSPKLVGYFSPGVATDKNHPQGHNGIDISASRGTPLYPIASGVVKDVGTASKSGNYVTCLHEDGGVQSFYAHLDSVSVRAGQNIQPNTPLGTIGDSGNAKGRGTHCHMEVKVKGSLINPLSIIGKMVGSLSK